jgi:predicted transcriptional regulator YdeE
MYEVKLVLRQKSKLIGFVLHTTFIENRQANDIPPFFHNIMQENSFESIPNRLNKNQICLFDKKPDSPNFNYYMGVEVESNDLMPNDMKDFSIPEGSYVTTSFIKTGNLDVLQALKFIMEKWIPENNLKQNQTLPVFVEYDNEFITKYKSDGYASKPIAKLFVPVI